MPFSVVHAAWLVNNSLMSIEVPLGLGVAAVGYAGHVRQILLGHYVATHHGARAASVGAYISRPPSTPHTLFFALGVLSVYTYRIEVEWAVFRG